MRLPNSVGISPVSPLPQRYNPSRLVRLPSSDGISPVNWLSLRNKVSRLVRLPNSDGISPVNWLSLMFKETTRSSDGPAELRTVTPSQSWIGRLADQFSTELPFVNASRAVSRFTQSDTSPGIHCGCGTTMPLEHWSMSEVGGVGVGVGVTTLSQDGNPNSAKSLSGTLNSTAGMHPVSWLPLIHNKCRSVRLPSVTGISPVNWLKLRSKYTRLVRLPSSGGISPVNWFLPSDRV